MCLLTLQPHILFQLCTLQKILQDIRILSLIVVWWVILIKKATREAPENGCATMFIILATLSTTAFTETEQISGLTFRIISVGHNISSKHWKRNSLIAGGVTPNLCKLS